MRRSIAITLLLLMLAALLAPAALATATSPLPACCRAGGRHHCAMMAALMASRGNGFRGPSCPFSRPRVFAASLAPPPATQGVTPADAHPFLHEFYPELFISQGEQPHPARAPPQPSSLK